MSIDVLMPALSPTMEEGTLAKWHVKVGDRVKAGDVIAEIETDKATMEVEAVDEGVIAEILVPEGAEEVKVNAPIARMEGEGAPSKRGATLAPGPAAASQPPAPAEGDEKPHAVEPEQSSIQGGGESSTRGGDAAPRPPGDGQRVFASPLARRLADQGQIDLGGVTGSGPHARIIRRDIEGLARSPKAATATTPAEKPAAGTRTLEEGGIVPDSYDLIPLTSMNKTVARRMTESFREVPHFPLSIDIQIDNLLAARAKINAVLEKEGVKVSVNDMVIKAAAAALMRVREANASYTPEGIALHHHADIAIAVAIDGGLITPIVRAAETKGLAQIAIEMKDLAERARARKLTPQEYQGGTFSLSNLGMMGVKSFASIINQPQGAILSVGAGEKRPVIHGDELAIATVMTVTLTCDHRVVDGAIGARWLAAFRGLIEDPITLII